MSFFRSIAFAFAVFAASITHAQQLERALVSPNAVDFVDNLTGADRESLVSDIADALARDGSDIDDLVNLLCEMEPWTTGASDTDTDLQMRLWRRAAAEQATWTELFGALDCAAANRTDFYFSDVVSPLSQIRSEVCDGTATMSAQVSRFPEIISEIEAVDAAILRGLTLPEFNRRKTRSFFPLRNAMRRALLEVAIGIEASKTDWSAAQDSFRNAASVLNEWNEVGRDGTTRILLRNTRNGWRFHNDLTLYSKVYRWLAGETDTLDLSEMQDWPAVIADMSIADGVAPSIERRMPSEFVDFIFVERFLPGAASADLECSRWRQRSYNTREFATHIQSCSDAGPVNSFDALVTFDDCVAEYEASDWRVQFLAFRSRTGWQGVAEDEVRKVREALETSPTDLSDVIASVGADEGSFIRIMTEEKFTTSRINAIRPAILTIFPDALFARPTLY